MKYINIAVICILCSVVTLSGQNNELKRANKKYDKFSYVPSRHNYRKALKKGEDAQEALQELGDTYYFNANFSEANSWYAELYKSYKDQLDGEYLFRFAQTLKSTGNYVFADEVLIELSERNSDDSRVKRFLADKDYLNTIESLSYQYEVEPVTFNSQFSEFAPSFYSGDIVFASNNEKGNRADQLTTWSDLPFYDLFVHEEGENVNFSKAINSDFHESTAIFTKDRKTVYFTRNNYIEIRVGKESKKHNLLKLYKSTLAKNGKWTKPKELPFNSDEYSVGHPALSPDESMLYFSSNMPGGLGYADIYRVKIEGDDAYSDPENIQQINTEGRDTFPFIDGDGVLYFSSNGYNGLGGLDVFKTSIADNFKEVTNLGKPINTPSDDITFIYDSESKSGYLASNRVGGLGLDDIYKFSFNPENPQVIAATKCTQPLTGNVKDKGSFESIASATVILLDGNSNILGGVVSASDGSFEFDNVDCSKIYELRVQKENYDPGEKPFSTTAISNSLVPQTLFLTPQIDELGGFKVGDDLAELLNLNPIYFDFDKSNIRPDAQIELNKVIAVLQKYPKMNIDVRSHTDSRGRDAYNLSLSQRRNKSTIAYIADVGNISRSRLTGRGYGETQLKNNCANGVKCSEEAHQLNRRSEFIIVE